MSFTIITLDGQSSSNAGGAPIYQTQIIVAGNDPDGLAQPITRDNPLPTAAGYGVSGKPPMADNLVAPLEFSITYQPIAGRPFNVDVVVTNDFDGRVQMFRSFDQGATWSGLTANGVGVASWTTNASETYIETEVGVLYVLQLAERVAGSAQVRISQ